MAAIVKNIHNNLWNAHNDHRPNRHASSDHIGQERNVRGFSYFYFAEMKTKCFPFRVKKYTKEKKCIYLNT